VLEKIGELKQYNRNIHEPELQRYAVGQPQCEGNMAGDTIT
jgi:hypothetical protein